MSEVSVRILTIFLASVFAWAALAKTFRFRAWQAVLHAYRLPNRVELPAAFLVPFVEAFVVMLLFVGETRAGASLSVMLLAAFSASLVRARALQGDRLPCGCFGADKERDYRLLLLRNAALSVLAAVLMIAGRELVPFEGLGWPSSGELVPTVMTLAGLAVAFWITKEVATSLRRHRP